jgi:amino acid adenylation domain-containing protein
VDISPHNELSASKRALLERWRRGRAAHSEQPIPRSEQKGSAPLSFAQERIWFLDQLTPGDPFHNIPAVFRLGGAVHLGTFEQSLAEVVRRQTMLRTSIRDEAGVPRQHLEPPGVVVLPVISLEVLDEETRRPELDRLISEETERGFDLARQPLWRIRLVRVGEMEHVGIATLHHIVADGWSIGVWLRELSTLYASFRSGFPSALLDPPVQYADYTVWQRERLQGKILASELQYWRSQLHDLPVLDLPVDRPRAMAQSARAGTYEFSLEKDIVDRLREVGRREGATLFMTLLAAFAVVLARYTEQEDFCIGTPTANRTRREVEGLIGHFVNTLAIRVDLRGDPSFAEVLRRVREAAVGAYAHQEVPFEKLVAELQPARDWSRNPLFDVMFVLQNTPMPTLGLEGLEVSWLNVPNRSSNFDVTLSLMEVDGALTGGLEYSPDLFDAKRMERLAGHLRQVLQGVAAGAAATAIWRVPLLTADERRELAGWSGAERGEASEAVMAAVAAQAARTPDAIAVAEGRRQLSYETLWARMAGLAERLTTGGVGPEVRVGVYVERSVEQVVAVGGVLAAGGVLVPLDPGAPRGRVAAQVADAGVQTMVTRRSLAAQVPAGPAVVLVEEGGAATGSAWPRASWPTQAAYVMYTSGSTGRPKGVVVEQGALAAYVATARVLYGVEARDRCLQFAALTFDTSVEEIWPCLVAGGRLVLRTEPMVQTPATFLAACAAAEVTVLNLPTAYWQAVVADQAAAAGAWPAAIRLVIIGGERAERRPWVAWQQWVGPGVALQNTYGPTETTVVATAAAVSAPTMCPAGAEVPIGRPLAHARVYVLDRWGEPVPIGVPGEICIGGAAVARGYWRQPGLTAEQFVPDPWAAQPGARLYRTGDWGRYRADGHLEYVGRRDRQVKLRGHRIELAEIEAAIRAHETVEDGAVVPRGDSAATTHLVAYVVFRSNGGIVGELRIHLREILPAYMLPSLFVELDALPLNRHGKLDRRALPPFNLDRSVLEPPYVAPRTATEELVANIWMELLGLDRVGVVDSFFDLGGHSLLAIQIISRVRATFRVELSLRQFFTAPTTGAMAAAIDAARSGPAAAHVERWAIARATRAGPAPVSFAQERLWFLDQLVPQPSLYNLPAVVRLCGPLHMARLEQSVTEVLRRHEILRTTFGSADGIAEQTIADPAAVVVPVVDLGPIAPAAREAEARRLVEEHAGRAFDLCGGPLWHLLIVRVADGDQVIAVAAHHIIVDGWSMQVLLRDILSEYGAFGSGRPSRLPELAVQYADYAIWQRQWLQGEVLGRDLDYWRARLRAAPTLAMPTDRPRPPVPSFRGGLCRFTVDAATADELAQLGRRQGATLFMTALAAFAVLLARYTGQDDLSVGTPVSGRTHAEVEDVIGLFVNTVVLRIVLDGDPDFLEVLQRVRETVLDGYAHQGLPFEKLVTELRPSRDASRNPLFQIAFALDHAPALARASFPGVESLELIDVETPSAKFDLLMSLERWPTELHGYVEYATDLFDRSTIERIVDQYRALLVAAVARPRQPIRTLAVVMDRERHQMLDVWNATTTPSPTDACLSDLFAAQVSRAPEATAVVWGSRHVSYGGLHARAKRMAAALRRAGVGPEVRVALCIDRSIELIVVLLAVLDAGGAYVPIDPAYPVDRQRFMLQDAEVTALVTESWLLERLPAFDGAVLCIDRDDDCQVESDEVAMPMRTVSADHLAYVMYTSGSTGAPKGVMVPHRAIARLVMNAGYVVVEPGARVAQGSNASFDAATFEIWGALLNGATLVGFERDTMLAPHALESALATYDVTILWLTASLFGEVARQCPQAYAALDAVLFGGEAVDPRWVRLVQASGAPRHLINGYGPTEATTFSLCHEVRVTDAERPSVPIGRPIANTRAYVLDEDGAPVPVGMTGEIHVGGAGLARGYWLRPGLTAERFVPDPFGAPGDRLYRTGDLGRHLGDGTVEYRGRRDRQVKLRGHRIELGEIEAALHSHVAVQDAVVTLRADRPGDQRLIAYIVGRGNAPVVGSDLRTYVKTKLPEYMVPTAFVEIEALPLGPNGKLDREALPVPEVTARQEGTAYIAPRTPTERMLAEIWAEVLGIECVGINDDFFEIGGHSILATRLCSRLRDIWHVDVPLSAIFVAPTISALMELVAQHGTGPRDEIPALVPSANRMDYEHLLSDLDSLSEEQVDTLMGQLEDETRR